MLTQLTCDGNVSADNIGADMTLIPAKFSKTTGLALFAAALLSAAPDRAEATEVVEADPDLARHPALREAITELLGPQAEYLDKT